MKEAFYYYRCTDPSRIKSYAVYDHAKGLVGFRSKLKEPVRAAYRIEFWGHWDEAELKAGYARRKVKSVRKQSKRQHNSEEGRY